MICLAIGGPGERSLRSRSWRACWCRFSAPPGPARSLHLKPTPPPPPEEIEQRDQLIADQENLLNAYRCLFNVDIDAVPGQCPNPATVSPGTAPKNPTRQDLAARDQLIADQEALLNAYRCQHHTDTQLVPGGCADQPGPQPTRQPAHSVTAITAGLYHSCGIRADSTVECWGNNEYGQADAPAGAFTAIAASNFHTCGIRADSTAECWGRNDEGQADAPAGAFTAIAASFRSCGIRADSTIECWGRQADPGGGAGSVVVRSGPPRNDSGQADGAFTAIIGRSSHWCVIKADSTVECWGGNDSGEANAPAGAFTAIAAGNNHTCGIRADSTAECWGNNEHGQADAPAGAFTAIAAGGYHSCGIRADSTVECWGAINRGAINYGQADAPAGAFTAIAAGQIHTCGIRADSTVECWGNNEHGQADAPAGAFWAN